MNVLLPALAVAMAAFCLWLGVRIVNRRERWAKRLFATIIGVPLLYVLSFGPACWLVHDRSLPEPALDAFQTFYTPIYNATGNDAGWFSGAIGAYVRCWSDEMVWRIFERRRGPIKVRDRHSFRARDTNYLEPDTP